MPPLASARITPPAPGYRIAYSGMLVDVSNIGYNWSSSVSGTNGVHLGFHATWLDPSIAGSHGYGFQLRCLSE